VAFCAAHIIPGIDFSNDPLLAGRIHSYVDTQISRLGGPNFHEIPINAPLAAVANNQRDGMHRQAIHRGRVAYEPNSLGGGCPFQSGRMGFMSFPQPVREDKVRGKPELFADHYSQARLFWQSQSPVEQAHIAHAFSFELSKVQVPAIRERTLAMLVNVDAALADMVALRLGTTVPDPQPMATSGELPSYQPSPALSLMSRPGETGIHGRKVAILIAPGCDEAMVDRIQAELEAQGAVARLVAPRVGMVGGLEADMSLETGPAVLFDAVVVPDGAAAAETLAANALAVEFVTLQYRHCKPLMVVGAGATLLVAAGVPATLPGGVPDPGLIGTAPSGLQGALAAFISAAAGQRVYDRETDPPAI
jgi:catalase